jgi:FkbM family methyltransferase
MRRAELQLIRAGAWVAGTLPDHLGQFRVAQRYWWKRRPEHQLLRQRLADGTPVVLDLGDRTQALAYLTRRYSEDLVQRVVDALPPRGVFFDVGANVGLITFQVAHRRPDVKIVAFEANPVAASAWRANRELHPAADAVLVDSAVSDRPGRVTIDAPSTDLGAGSIRRGSGGVEVAAVTIDGWCEEHEVERIDVMKIDVEGSEPEVLRGAQRLITGGAIRSLLVEVNDGYFTEEGRSRQALLDWLATHGMTLRGRDDLDDLGFAPVG